MDGFGALTRSREHDNTAMAAMSRFIPVWEKFFHAL